MTRHPDWQNRLADYVAGVAAMPFAWGIHDCALFTAGAVRAMTGRDLARGWRGYRSRGAGLRKLAAAGLEDPVALAASLLPEIAPLAAMPGDVVAHATETGPALGILQGRGFYALTPTGLAILPRAGVLRAFRV